MQMPLHFHFFYFNHPATTAIYTLSLHDALPICRRHRSGRFPPPRWTGFPGAGRNPACAANPRESCDFGSQRSEEHTSELQSLTNLVCRLLLEKKKKTRKGKRTPCQPRLSTNLSV